MNTTPVGCADVYRLHAHDSPEQKIKDKQTIEDAVLAELEPVILQSPSPASRLTFVLLCRPQCRHHCELSSAGGFFRIRRRLPRHICLPIKQKWIGQPDLAVSRLSTLRI